MTVDPEQGVASHVDAIIEFGSKADYIVRALRQQILDGTLEPGSSLRQRDIADKFQVSPTPVREALSRLRAEGYVETKLHQGATVVRG